MSIRLLTASIVGAIAVPMALAAQLPTPDPPDGRRLQPGLDSLAIYLIRGNDTARTGVVWDELAVQQRDGDSVLIRFYHSVDEVLGQRVDTIIDRLADLRPLVYTSRSTRALYFFTFDSLRVRGSMGLPNGDSVAVDVPLGEAEINSASFDLAIRASQLEPELQFNIPAFLPSARNTVWLRARVTGVETIGAHPCWKVSAEFSGLAVTFWIDQQTRALRQQLMHLEPDVQLLFTVPRAAAARKRAT